MWNCETCGTRAIAHGLLFCPGCGAEDVMPKATTGGVSSAWEEGPAVVDEAPEGEPPAAADETLEEPVAVDETPEEVVAGPTLGEAGRALAAGDVPPWFSRSEE